MIRSVLGTSPLSSDAIVQGHLRPANLAASRVTELGHSVRESSLSLFRACRIRWSDPCKYFGGCLDSGGGV